MPGGIRITLHGDEELIARLLEVGPRARRLAKQSLQDSVDHVRNRAVEGIASGPKTGRVYTTRFWTDSYGRLRIGEARTPHQASARGEYPAADTGNLMRSIWAEVDDTLATMEMQPDYVQLSFDFDALDQAAGMIEGQVGADAEYAVHLEYKAPTMGGRPFLRRALAESEDFIRQRFLELRGRIFDE